MMDHLEELLKENEEEIANGFVIDEKQLVP